MKKISEFAARRDELAASIATLTAEFETARASWRMSGYRDDNAYNKMNETEKALFMVRAQHEDYTLLASEKPIYANQHFYTDVEPWEVVKICTDKKVLVRKMKTALKPAAHQALADSFVPGGFFGHTNNDLQEWDFTSDENGETVEIRRHKYGDWRIAGCSTRFYLSDTPEKYFDYNF